VISIAKHFVLNGLRHVIRQRQISRGFKKARKDCEKQRDNAPKDPADWTCNGNCGRNAKCKTLALRSVK